LRRRLRRVERLSEAATAAGLRSLKTPASRSSALLVRVTCCDHFLPPSLEAALGADGLRDLWRTFLRLLFIICSATLLL